MNKVRNSKFEQTWETDAAFKGNWKEIIALSNPASCIYTLC